jgi:hypothetical protein
MLQQIYKDQLLVFRDSHPTMPKKLKKFSTVYVEVYDKIKKDILHKGTRDMTVDPQINTIKDTYDLDELEKIVNVLFDEGTVAGDRALGHVSVGTQLSRAGRRRAPVLPGRPGEAITHPCSR